MNFRELTSNDDSNDQATSSFINTLTVNIAIFVIIIVLFEFNRNIRLIFLKRVNKKLQRSNRVPPIPPKYPFGWIAEISKISEEQLIPMIGLDAYMLLRYINICFRFSGFVMFFGLVVLIPIYKTSGDYNKWTSFTLANIPNDPGEKALWVPVVFCYLFSSYFCYLMYNEYKNFVDKRFQYLLNGDPDTPPQTYYTVLVERVPSDLRSEPALRSFFEKLFPGQVYSVEISLEVNDLEKLVQQRREARDNLEKAIAVWKATQKRPVVWVLNDVYSEYENPPQSLEGTYLSNLFGYNIYDSIEHHSRLLQLLNERVKNLQLMYLDQLKNASSEYSKIQGRLEAHTSAFVGALKEKIIDNTAPVLDRVTSKFSKPKNGEDPSSSLLKGDELSSSYTGTSNDGNNDPDYCVNQNSSSKSDENGRSDEGLKKYPVLNIGARIVNAAGSGVEGLAKEGLKTAQIATKGALRGVLEATRTLELLTLGAFYKISSTAFVTLTTRKATSSAHQMLLSQNYYKMSVKCSPNPKDVIWENISIPEQQCSLRHQIADYTLILGALCWSFVVGFIATVGNMDSLSQQFTWLQAYSSTMFYQFLNSYLAAALLLILLNLLPSIFDLIARNYEGMKQESEIQNSIMTRYFYYQLANVFVSVGLGSLISSVHQIIDRPSSILSILGNSLPDVSIYFTNLLIVKTFTALPLEHIRFTPLIQILSVIMCLDKKKCTRRELRTGAFADPPMLYGWIYPNIMMVLMILTTYACIAPFTVPFCFLFFGFSYLMYKYQFLYVYITEYQAGGYMWYAVFGRSMVCLIGGVVTLICYLGIRETFFSGPFYLLLPLPVLIIMFWNRCEAMFKGPSMNLSLESSIDLDEISQQRLDNNRKTAHSTFAPTLFRQPSLAEGTLRPEPYRTPRLSEIDVSPLHGILRGKSIDSDNGGSSFSSSRKEMAISPLDSYIDHYEEYKDDEVVGQEEEDIVVQIILESSDSVATIVDLENGNPPINIVVDNGENSPIKAENPRYGSVCSSSNSDRPRGSMNVTTRNN